MNRKVLCLFANEFPYGNWEPYLETECNFYSNFDKVFIFSLQLRKQHEVSIRKVPANCTVIPVRYAPRWKYLLNSFRVLKDKNLYRELFNLKHEHMLSFGRIVDLFVYLSRSDYEARIISKGVERKELEGAVFYSYRFEYQPYVAMLLRKKIDINSKIIARAHGYDLYDERHVHKYIPCRGILLEGIDRVCPCSQFGKEYLEKKFPQYSNKICVCYLGTHSQKIKKYEKKDELRIVSCSNLVPVKRVELIVSALMKSKGRHVRWTHFGDGTLLNEIKEMAKMLPENIKVDFRGNVENTKVLRAYEEEYFDLFINTSSMEGVPVSIMEAMSFGIPCIATDVGGTKELVTDKHTGVLLRPDFTDEEFWDAINWYTSKDENDIRDLRNDVHALWDENFNADRNYSSFIAEIAEM